MFLVLLFTAAEVFAYAPQLHGHSVAPLNLVAHRLVSGGPAATVSAAPGAADCAACNLLSLSASLSFSIAVFRPAFPFVETLALIKEGRPSIELPQPSGRAPPSL